MPNTLLDHVHTITLHRDTVLLDRGVVASLLELLQLEDARLLEICKLDGELYFTVSAWSDESGEVHGQDDLPPDAEALPLSAYAGARDAVASGSVFSAQTPGDHRHWLPVYAGEGPIACFELCHPAGLSTHQLDLAAGIIGLYRNYRTLLEDSQQDTLTGLNNRKTFDGSLQQFLSSASQSGGATPERRHAGSDHWLAVLDVDHFKRINDRFGHLYGDEVLILIANLMRRSFRQGDKFFRFGGEEFVVLLRHVDAEGARATLERFRQALAGEAFPQVGQVTVSIGFTRAQPGDTPAEVLGRADEALYFAKANGRNRVAQYEVLVADGMLTAKTVHTEAEFF